MHFFYGPTPYCNYSISDNHSSQSALNNSSDIYDLEAIPAIEETSIKKRKTLSVSNIKNNPLIDLEKNSITQEKEPLTEEIKLELQNTSIKAQNILTNETKIIANKENNENNKTVKQPKKYIHNKENLDFEQSLHINQNIEINHNHTFNNDNNSDPILNLLNNSNSDFKSDSYSNINQNQRREMRPTNSGPQGNPQVNNNARHNNSSNQSSESVNPNRKSQNHKLTPISHKESHDENHSCNSYETISPKLLDLEISKLNTMPIKELRDLANEYHADLNGLTNKQHIINAIIRKAVSIPNSNVTCSGILEVLEDNGGFGFLRSSKANYAPSNNDVYIPTNYIRRYNLETGHDILCTIKQPNSKKGERYYPIDRILKINGRDVLTQAALDEIKERRHFDDLVPCFPNKRYKLENNKSSPQDNLINRMIDLMSPIGKGQRALIVAPPRVGKTTLLKCIANSLLHQYPESKIFVLLIDERPEEVTDITYSLKGAEIISSTFDESADNHVHVAEMLIQRAKRLVEDGQDVVIFLDSLTRVARAYNTVTPSSGKVLTGGVDSGALQRPKRLFGAARNIENGGSLTIIASALVETGSRMDEVIFEEFKGTGNCEIVLDRKIAEKRLFPALDILKSGTRKEELLLSQNELQRIWLLRRALANTNANEALELLRDKILSSKTNEDFLSSLGNSSIK